MVKEKRKRGRSTQNEKTREMKKGGREYKDRKT
jgi:hypothetical protein